MQGYISYSRLKKRGTFDSPGLPPGERFFISASAVPRGGGGGGGGGGGEREGRGIHLCDQEDAEPAQEMNAPPRPFSRGEAGVSGPYQNIPK